MSERERERERKIQYWCVLFAYPKPALTLVVPTSGLSGVEHVTTTRPYIITARLSFSSLLSHCSPITQIYTHGENVQQKKIRQMLESDDKGVKQRCSVLRDLCFLSLALLSISSPLLSSPLLSSPLLSSLLSSPRYLAMQDMGKLAFFSFLSAGDQEGRDVKVVWRKDVKMKLRYDDIW